MIYHNFISHQPHEPNPKGQTPKTPASRLLLVAVRETRPGNANAVPGGKDKKGSQGRALSLAVGQNRMGTFLGMRRPSRLVVYFRQG